MSSLSAARGKHVGVTRFGGTTDFATPHFLRLSGFDPAELIYNVSVKDVVASGFMERIYAR